MPSTPLRTDLPAATGPVTLTGEGLSLTLTWAPPLARPAAPGVACWIHRARRESPRTLAGRPGRLVADTYTALGLELTREAWLGEGGEAVALRLRLRNASAAPLRLDALLPVQADGPEGLLLAGQGAAGWEVIAHQRQKNGIPSSFRPGVHDADWAHATRGATEIGGTPSGDGGASEAVEMDPLCLLRPAGARGPVLLCGFLSQLGHCARWWLRFQGAGNQVALAQLQADCEFDGSLLPPGGERTSQWCLLRGGERPDELMADYAERVAAYHGVAEPAQPPPSVLCSWYYYGPHFTERDFLEDLGYLERDRIPFDVFLIDECWDLSWGDWEGSDEWPSGMQAAADRIRALGYRPGLWTCPFIAKIHSRFAVEHGEWLLRRNDGAPVLFPMDGLNYVLDPTYPGVCDWIEALFRKMTEDWGYTYHKLDFTRAVFLDKEARFFDGTKTRLEAYRMALEAVRRGAGPGSYISVCGGHYGGSLGLADSQRSGSDVVARWNDPPALPKFKQNLLRTWMNRLWHVDADAMMVRRRDQPINNSRHGRLSLGQFTDDEAVTITLNQYLGGGITCFTEKFLELDADRKALYRHVVPAHGVGAIPLDPFEPTCPSYLLTRIAPRCPDLGPWVTVAAVNWTDAPRPPSIALEGMVTASIPAARYLAFDLIRQECLGLFAAGETIALGEQAPHASRLVRLAPWDGRRPVLAGTDLHYSGGGVEVAEWRVEGGAVRGRITTAWDYPVRVCVAFPAAGGYALQSAIVPPGEGAFAIAQEG